MKRILAVVLAMALLIPAAALGEATALPFGLKMGMSPDEAKAAFKADGTLSKIKYDKEDYDSGAVEYMFEDVDIPGTDETADSMTVQIDQNNSAKADRLTTITFDLSPTDSSIATFRKLLGAITASYGNPATDPFGEDGVSAYVEWGTLDASWATDDVRISLSLSRMYEESVSIMYSSRLNYDKADLAE